MCGIYYCDFGCIGVLLMDNDVMVEFILDGIYLYLSIMNMVYCLKGVDKIVFIIDCVSVGGL